MFIGIDHRECLINLLGGDEEKFRSLLDFMESRRFIITEIKPIAKTSNTDRFVIAGVTKMELKQGGFGYVLVNILVSMNRYKNTFTYNYRIR